MTQDDTVALLAGWYQGDTEALGKLLFDNREWLEAHVARHVPDSWRRHVESADFVQDAALRVLKAGVRFAPCSRAQFRALMGRILVNLVRDQADRLRGPEHDIAREQPLPSHLSSIKSAESSLTGPERAAERSGARQWIRLAMDTLAEEDRALIKLRSFYELEWADVGERLGLSADAARQRYTRSAMPALERAVRALQRAAEDFGRPGG